MLGEKFSKNFFLSFNFEVRSQNAYQCCLATCFNALYKWNVENDDRSLKQSFHWGNLIFSWMIRSRIQREKHEQRAKRASEKSGRVSWLSVVCASDRRWFHWRARCPRSKCLWLKMGMGGLRSVVWYTTVITLLVYWASISKGRFLSRVFPRSTALFDAIRQRNRIRFLLNALSNKFRAFCLQF